MHGGKRFAKIMGENICKNDWRNIFAKLMGEKECGKNTEQDNLKHFHNLFAFLIRLQSFE